jgi:hypothetical protein
MTQCTKTTFIIAVVYSSGLILTLGCILYVIHMQGTKLEEAKTTIAEHTAKELAYANVTKVLETSEADRAKLDSYFISDKDTISFITELESTATSFGVILQTTGLSVTPATTVAGVVHPPVLSVGLRIKGDKVAVKKYIVLLENIPYHKQISSFMFSSDAATNASEAVTTLSITMKP